MSNFSIPCWNRYLEGMKNLLKIVTSICLWLRYIMKVLMICLQILTTDLINFKSIWLIFKLFKFKKLQKIHLIYIWHTSVAHLGQICICKNPNQIFYHCATIIGQNTSPRGVCFQRSIFTEVDFLAISSHMWASEIKLNYSS